MAVGPADRQQVAVGPADRQQVAVGPADRQQVGPGTARYRLSLPVVGGADQ